VTELAAPEGGEPVVLTWLAFDLGPLHCALPLPAVHEILRVPELTPVPGAPAHVLGVMAGARELITVVELSARVGVAVRPRDDRNRILLLRHENERIGVRVCAVVGVLRLGRTHVRPVRDDEPDLVLPPHYLAGCAQHATTRGPLWLLDASQLLL
jgi:chemotaxis signal transduction protein